MKNILFIVFVLITGATACKKKDTYGYTCRCQDKNSGQTDTIYTLRVPTSGEASYRCKDFADTANASGKNIECKID
ncbi:MAG TPA: hypothetical protein VIN07_10145 [Flavipsychrobacter sp.]